MSASARLALAAALLASGCAPEAPDVDWPHYLGDPGRSQYSELTEIDRANVAELRLAWRYDAGDLQPGVSIMDSSPLVVDGVLVGLSPTLAAFALNAATGEELWRFRPDGAANCVQRGLLFWRARAESDADRLLFTVCAVLFALDPASGRLDDAFAGDGRLDLSTFVDGARLHMIEPGTAAGEFIVFGLRTPGLEDDAETGSAVVALRGADGSLAWRYSAGSAGAMAFDAERRLLFAPTQSDLLALDAANGELRWQRPVIGVGQWLTDQAVAAPTLVTVASAGVPVDAVAVPTRQGRLHVFDRDSGEPLGDPAGMPLAAEAFRPSARTPAVAERMAHLATLMEEGPNMPPTPAGRLMFPGLGAGTGWGGGALLPDAGRLIVNVQETASVLRRIEIPAGFSERSIYMQHCARCHGADREGLYPDRPERYGAGGPSLIGLGERLSSTDIRTVIERGRGSMPAFDQLNDLERLALETYLLSDADEGQDDSRRARSLQAPPVTLRDADGLPGNAPPWGALMAIDLVAGSVLWQAPLGNYLSHPGLGLGSENVGGPVATASGLVFIAATPDMKLRAFDADDGSVLWEADLPAGGYSTPIVYRAGGRQFVAMAAGGGRFGPPSGADYLAFALPP